MLRIGALRPALEKLTASVVLPLVDFIQRQGVRMAVPILALIVTYRLNYMTMGVAANTFYLDLGYTLDQIALVSKLYGVALTLTGAVFAGWLVKRLDLLPSMLVGLLLLSCANLLYAYIAGFGTASAPDIGWLAAAVSLDNVANGIAGTAFIAYMSSLTSKQYTATQYALFGTLWSLPAKSLASQWGRIVDAWGYPPFFAYTALMGLPALLLILWLMRRAPARHA
jgi:PAT family beta-lactamase induction signal transducer AmpG